MPIWLSVPADTRMVLAVHELRRFSQASELGVMPRLASFVLENAPATQATPVDGTRQMLELAISFVLIFLPDNVCVDAKIVDRGQANSQTSCGPLVLSAAQPRKLDPKSCAANGKDHPPRQCINSSATSQFAALK